MALTPGTRLGPYEIQAVLGAGGMGEVYRALDTALNRPVAIKVLPDGFAGDEERVGRFTREAQTLAALNHPNIATIYGLQDVGGQQLGLVMELVEGDDLSELIARGPMPVPDALPIARQIADALEAAHELGIIHRDLKPANIKVRADGTVKVLDFGLAKALTPDSAASSANNMNSPTLTARATQLGVILGTAAYMAPEQAKGKAVDRRADIWAFGVVLYEMLSGRRAFDGEDVSMTLAAVLMRDPDWNALPADTPPALRALVRRCLERDPKLRLRDIGEARVWLTNPEATISFASAQIAPHAEDRSRRGVGAVLIAVGLIAAAAIGAWASRWLEPAAPIPVRTMLSVPTGTLNSGGALMAFALSPDGKMLAFIAAHPKSNSNVIWVRSLSELEPRILPGTDMASALFWAPDSRRLGFVETNTIKIVDTSGGVPQSVVDVVAFQGATWNTNGTMLVAHGGSPVKTWLSTVSEHGGTFHDLLQPDAAKGETSLNQPSFLPDGKHFLYLCLATDPAKSALYAGSLDGGTPVFLMNSLTAPVFVAPSTLLFLRDATLLAQTFDPDRFSFAGEPVRIADGVMYRASGRAAVAASQTGILAYRQGTTGDSVSDLTWIGRAGQEIGTVGEPGRYNQLRLSPDEQRVAVAVAEPGATGYNLWVLNLANGIMSQATFEQAANDPVWMPDKQTVLFESIQKGKRDFYRLTVGARATSVVYESATDPKWIDDVSADGQYLLFHVPRPAKLFALALSGKSEPQVLAESQANVDGAHFSLDRRWVAYGLNETGTYEVWVAAFPAFDRRQRVSSHGGGQAFWKGDGSELYYLSLDGKMMSISVSPTGVFGAPREMFQSPIPAPPATIDQYSVTADGQRFLFLKPRKDQASVVAPITVIVNWQAATKK